MVPALPAVLALAFWPLFEWATWRLQGSTETRYALIADRALTSRDLQEARVACERLLRLDGVASREPHVYRMALCRMGLGQAGDALSLLRSIAPEETQGFGPAHAALATLIMQDPQADAKALRLAETHLRRALLAAKDSAELKELMGHLHTRLGNYDQARRFYLEAEPYRPTVSLALASLASTMGNAVELNQWAQATIRDGRKQLKNRPSAVADWLRVAEAFLLLRDFDSAMKEVENGIANANQPALHEMAARICAVWVQDVGKRTPQDLATRLRLVQRGLSHDPKNVALLQELVGLARGAGTQAADAQQALNRILARGDAAATAHFCLAMNALEGNRLEEARSHFEILFKDHPQAPVVANNLAYLLTFSEPPELKRAFDLIAQVLQRFPDSPAFRETRGHILVKMGKYREALADLEYALPTHRGNPTTHHALGVVYRQLGLLDLAQEHERLSSGASR